ncbi:hypothetical protein GCM10027610_073930 [Dactylosporangium cerinum]
MSRVVIGIDPHKRSATIEAIDERENVLTQGRFGTDTAGYQLMLTAGRAHADRVWAVEGCYGIGRHIAQRLVADGEPVLDVPPKMSARVRVFDTGQGRKTDPVDAHSVAVAGLRSRGLRAVSPDDVTVVVRLLVDRRDELDRARTDIVSRIHHLLLQLIPGGAKKFLTRGQASYLLRTAVLPDGIVARTRHDLARELIEELTTIDAKIRAADKQLRQLVTEHGSTLTGPARHRPVRRRPADRRHRRHPPVPHPSALRLLERHRATRGVLRRPTPPPALPRRKPSYQPRPAHHGHRPAPP